MLVSAPLLVVDVENEFNSRIAVSFDDARNVIAGMVGQHIQNDRIELLRFWLTSPLLVVG